MQSPWLQRGGGQPLAPELRTGPIEFHCVSTTATEGHHTPIIIKYFARSHN